MTTIMDTISLSLGLPQLSEQTLKVIKTRVTEVSSLGVKCDIPAWNRGLTLGERDEETKQKISKTLTGQSLSEERKNKIARSVKTYVENKKDFGFKKNGSNAGKIGGKSKSEKKISAVLESQIKSLEVIKGSSWMHNPKTNVRNRVSKNLIKTKLEEGWVFGMGESK